MENGRLDPEPLAQPPLEREFERVMEPAAEGGQDREAEFARWVEERLDEHGIGVGNRARRAQLSGEVANERLGGIEVEVAFLDEPVGQSRVVDPLGDFAADRGDGLAEFGRPR